MNKRPMIMLITDAREKNLEVAGILGSLQKDLCAAIEEAKGVRLFESRKPSVILLLHDSLEDSVRFYECLVKQSEQFHIIPHQTIVLCKAPDIGLAYNLCERGIFDEYMVIEPLQDKFRLQQMVKSALQHLEYGQEASGFRKGVSQIGQEIESFYTLVDEVVDKKADLQREADKTFDEFSTRIKEELGGFSQELGSEENADVVKVLDENALADKIAEFSEQKIQQEVGRVRRELDNTIDDWTGYLENGCKQHDQVRQSLSELVESVPTRVLVVEDDEVYAEVVKSILSAEGYEVDHAGSGVQGLNHTIRWHPDVVLLDYGLPDLTGQDFLARVKSEKNLQHIPIIMLTGNSAPEVVQATMKMGAADFIVKPADRATIIDKVKQMLV